MDNLISNKAVIDALEKCHKMCCREDDCGDEWVHYETVLNEVECISPAQPESSACWVCNCPKMQLLEKDTTQKIGYWIPVHPLQADDEGAYLCSNCNTGDWDIKSTDKYCKFCGAKMQGVKKV